MVRGAGGTPKGRSLAGSVVPAVAEFLTGRRRTRREEGGGGSAALPPGNGTAGGQGRFARVSGAARAADHYHSASEHGIIGRRIETVVAVRLRFGGRWGDTARAMRPTGAVPG